MDKFYPQVGFQPGTVERGQLIPLAVQLAQDPKAPAVRDVDTFRQPQRPVRAGAEIAAGGLVLRGSLQPGGVEAGEGLRLAALQGDADQGERLLVGLAVADRAQEIDGLSGDAGALRPGQGGGEFDLLRDVDDAVGIDFTILTAGRQA